MHSSLFFNLFEPILTCFFSDESINLEIGDIIEFRGNFYPDRGSDHFPVPFFGGENFNGEFDPTTNVMEIPEGILEPVAEDTPLTSFKLAIFQIKHAEKPIESKDWSKEAADLSDFLIDYNYPFAKLKTDELTKLYGVELVRISNGPHQHICKILVEMGYSFGNPYQNWKYKRYLEWGKVTGWNVSNDEKYAVCRKQYDDYYLFRIDKIMNDNEKVVSKIEFPQAALQRFLSLFGNETNGSLDKKTFMLETDVKKLSSLGLDSSFKGEYFNINLGQKRKIGLFFYAFYLFFDAYSEDYNLTKDFIALYIQNTFENFKDMTINDIYKRLRGDNPPKFIFMIKGKYLPDN